MRNNIKKLMLRKQSGDSGYLSLAVSFIILVIFTVVLLFVYMYGILCMNTSDNIDLVMTTYCKRMESQGCLTSNEVNEMKEQLAEYGMTNITVSGEGVESPTKIPYGEKVSIKVEGDIDYVDSSKMGNISGTIQFLRDFLNNQDIGKVTNRTMIKSGTSKC